MRTKQFYLAIILGVTFVCGGSAFAQGKHGGGKNGGGNGKGNGGGGEVRVDRGNGGDKGRSREMRVENGNQNWRGDEGDRGRGNGNGKIRGGERESRGNRDSRVERQPQSDWDARRQQQQNEWNARRQKQVNDWNAQRQRQIDNERGRRQQDVNEWNARRQRQIIDDNERFERQREKHNRKKDKRSDKWNERSADIFGDRGGFPIFSDRDKSRKHRKHDRDDRDERFDRRGSWQGRDNFPRGHAYGRRGIWPGEFRGWRDPDKQARQFEKRDRKHDDYRDNYYYRERGEHEFNIGDDRYDDDDYSRRDDGFTRRNIIRTILSNFFDGGFNGGQDAYATNYYPQGTYVNYAPAYYGNQPSYAAVPQYYSQSYYPSYNDGYYGDAYDSPAFGSDLFGGGNSLSSGLFSIVGQLLSGLLGQGYLQGLNDGDFARDNRLRNVGYNNPYEFGDAYSAPYTASLDQQRSLLRQGYELGYQDALRDRDPFETQNFGGNFGGIDILNAFLGDGLRFN
ncbi:MAG: hypothetical protein WBD16_07855 [Pyrinomonadaceae bacterium]